MGTLRSGILGHLSGKVAGVVGSRWKDQSTLREYVIPANPDTDPQKAQRSKMSIGVAFGKALVGQVFNVYVDKFQKSMSGFNYFLSQNMALFLTPITFASIMLVWGKLWKLTVTTAIYTVDTVQISWVPGSYGNNGESTDMAYAAVYDTASALWYFAAAEVERGDNSIDVPMVAGLTVANLKAYVWVSKYSPTSPTLLDMVSDSTYHAVSAT